MASIYILEVDMRTILQTLKHLLLNNAYNNYYMPAVACVIQMALFIAFCLPV